MPQMSPMWWMTLMFVFNFTLLIINSNLFFNKNYNLKSNLKIKNKNFIWKW